MRPDMTALAVFFCVVLLSGCMGQYGITGEKRESERLFENTVSAEILSLDFESHNGFIEVSIWDNPSYRIEITTWARASSAEEAQRIADDLRVDFSEATGTEVILELDIENRDNTGAEIRAYIPAISLNTLTLETSNGYISLEDALTATDISLTSSNGQITASCSAEDITVTTSNGRITGSFEGEDVEMRTSNGQIDVQCGTGNYSLTTSNGRVKVTTGESGSFDISTSNGSVTVIAQGDFSFDLSTSNASIDIRVAPVTYTIDERSHKKGYSAEEDAPLSISVSTSNGMIILDV